MRAAEADDACRRPGRRGTTAPRTGTIRNRAGDPYKPSALRGYEGAMRRRVLPALGGVRLADLRRSDLQDFADGLLAKGPEPIDGPGHAAAAAGDLPARRQPRRGRRRTRRRPGAARRPRAPRADRLARLRPRPLIAAAPDRDRALWATALYAGLRRGELRALRVEDVDLAAGVIHVERGWDPREGADRAQVERRAAQGADRRRAARLPARAPGSRSGAPGDRADLRPHRRRCPFTAEHAPGAEPTRRGPRPGSSGSRRTSAATPSPR